MTPDCRMVSRLPAPAQPGRKRAVAARHARGACLLTNAGAATRRSQPKNFTIFLFQIPRTAASPDLPSNRLRGGNVAFRFRKPAHACPEGQGVERQGGRGLDGSGPLHRKPHATDLGTAGPPQVLDPSGGGPCGTGERGRESVRPPCVGDGFPPRARAAAGCPASAGPQAQVAGVAPASHSSAGDSSTSASVDTSTPPAATSPCGVRRCA